MPECHRCQYNGKSSQKCISCRGPSETNHKGQTFVSLQASDGEGDTQTDAEVEIALAKAAALEDTFVEYTEAEQAARAVAYAFTELSLNEWKLVQRLMRGEKMCEVARTLNVTKVAISLRVKALVEKHPSFAFLRSGWRP